ncbi:AbrB/MazE/SpoVT family DNA-binding domain-containing protein [Patescibacteria group bacterium]|nr:AbrB/MazE/SpoVT family DNA-binding domain-containing protein [Patescibacteria group bacterium]
MKHFLKLFNTGQVTLPKKWRDKFQTKHFIAEETDKGLLIKPVIDEDVIEFENDEEVGLYFPKGIHPNKLIEAIKKIDG